MARELALAGLVAVSFGLGSFYATDHFGTFSAANLLLGAAALLTALALGARRLRFTGGPHSRRVVLRGLALIAGALALAALLERAASRSGIRFDWTFERRFQPSEAVRAALADLCARGPVEATLYVDPLDPRKRGTGLLLETLALGNCLGVRERILEDSPEDEDRYGIGSSNTVVVRAGDRFDTVERPLEGTLYEAFYRLLALQSGVIALLRGEGEGDPERADDLGYSGLATALATEGYRVRDLVSAAMGEVPADVDAVIAIAPRRRLRPEAIAALRRYLEGGGSLVALLEPGQTSGLEELLAEYGLESPNAVIVDPASGRVEGAAEGINIVAHNYQSHPISHGLGRNRMTFFPGARSFVPRNSRPRPGDAVTRVVMASPRSWLSEDLSVLGARAGGVKHDGQRQDYHVIVAAGRYPRPDGEARIVAIGDSGFASNRYLRALYDLDLMLNAVHWAVAQEPRITLRPKVRETVQFPLPIANTFAALYGVGLLIPELLLIVGGTVWLRRRRA